jgi:polysaccharide deacetylase 2 family uncharacterized protein YibQ
MAKKKKKHSKSLASEKYLHYIVWVLAIIATLIVSFLVGYYIGYKDGKKDAMRKLEKKEHNKPAIVSKPKHVKKQTKELHKKLEKVLTKEQKKYDITAAHEIEDKKLLQPLKKKNTQPLHQTKKPQLAIIFDDVSFPSQVRAIRALGLKVTMSFFPPSPIHPHTPELAKKQKFYMIHLPMEAMNFHKEEPFTLRVTDSQATIQKRIAKIKKLFPKVHYINNHTGSKFTANTQAVERLVRVLDKYNIKFIDSRTTANTKVPVVMKKYHHKYLVRDVFLDHAGDIASIKKQIRLAVKIAKKYGHAIAIGHPHPNTLKALAASKNILQSVELVYVNQLR